MPDNDFDFPTMMAQLVIEEGERLTVYDDATGEPLRPGMILKGNPTIGVGRCLTTEGMSPLESRYLLRNDVAAILAELERFPWWEGLDAVRKRAVVSMRFNLGRTGFLAFQAALAALAVGHFDAAADAMEASRWRAQLPARVEKLAGMVRKGVDPFPAVRSA